tara:strand:- start:326 stop:499 length:174 start_codon:yes stop_codon:yes gene_type:complete
MDIPISRRNKYQMEIDRQYPQLKNASLKELSIFFKLRLPDNKLKAQKIIYNIITNGE